MPPPSSSSTTSSNTRGPSSKPSPGILPNQARTPPTSPTRPTPKIPRRVARPAPSPITTRLPPQKGSAPNAVVVAPKLLPRRHPPAPRVLANKKKKKKEKEKQLGSGYPEPVTSLLLIYTTYIHTTAHVGYHRHTSRGHGAFKSSKSGMASPPSATRRPLRQGKQGPVWCHVKRVSFRISPQRPESSKMRFSLTEAKIHFQLALCRIWTVHVNIGVRSTRKSQNAHAHA